MWTEVDRETYKADGRRYPSDLTDRGMGDPPPLCRSTIRRRP